MDREESIERVWQRIDELRPGRANRYALGAAFHELRLLFSDRNSGGLRLTSGHGVFEDEIRRRGFKPRTVREWIADYEAALAGQPTAAKRRARRATRLSDLTRDLLGNGPTDPRLEFVQLLPFRAAQLAYREAAIMFHPDHGGLTGKMQRLNAAWTRAKGHFSK